MYRAMLQNILARPLRLILGFALIVAVVIDMMQLARPSGLAALSCVSTLLRETPALEHFASAHRDAIVQQARINSLPAVLVAAVLVDHQRQLTRTRAFADCAGSALGANLSLGPAQVRISTAALLEGASLPSLSPTEFRALRARLLDPETNISYEAKELRALLERPGRFPGMSAATLLNNPAAMALVITEYRWGRMPTPVAVSRVGVNAARTLNLMQDDILAQYLDAEDDPARIRGDIRAYVETMSCGRLNRACASIFTSRTSGG